MDRNELLNKLHSIKIGAQPTAMTMDMGLEYEYVTGEGFGASLGNMGEWPVYKLENIQYSDVEIIKEKLNEGLTVEHIKDTSFGVFAKYIFEEKRPDIKDEVEFLFEGVSSIKSVENNALYALCDLDQWSPKISFFESEDELEQAFCNEYIYDIQEWETLTDEELEEWVDHIEEELGGLDIYLIGEESEIYD